MADAADSTPASDGQFTLTVADLNTAVNNEPRVSHRRLAQALGYVDDRKLLRLAERHREALLRFGEVSATVAETTARGGRPGKVEWYNKRQALYLCTKSETARATETTIQMVEVFDAHLAARAAPRPEAAPIAPVPFLAGPEPLVSSLHLAQALRRRHTGILRLLDVLAAERPEMLGPQLRFSTYLHENGRPYRCFHLGREAFEALMARIPSSDLVAASVRAATLRGWPDAPALPAPAAPAPVLDRDGLAMVRVDGATIKVDLLDIDLTPSARSLVFDHAGRLSIDTLAPLPHLDAIYGRRATVAGRPADGQDRTDPGGRPIVWAIGMVVEARDVILRGAPRAGAGGASAVRAREAVPALLPARDLAAIEVCGRA